MRDWLEPSEVLWPDPEVGPWRVVLSWSQQEGRVECTGLSLALIGGHGSITTRLLRDLRVAERITRAREERYLQSGGGLAEAIEAGEIRFVAEVVGEEGSLMPVDVEGLRRAAEPWEDSPRGRPREYGIDHYREVARVYSVAFDLRQSPRLAVQRHFGRPAATASRWIGTARQLGLLPPTEPGTAKGNQVRPPVTGGASGAPRRPRKAVGKAQ